MKYRSVFTMFQNHITQKLSAYLHDELSPHEVSGVSQHLISCRRCRAEYEEIRFGAQMAERLMREQPPESLWNELEIAISNQALTDKRIAGATQRGSIFSVPALRYAIGVALVILIAITGLQLIRKQPEPDLADLPAWEVRRIEGNPVIGTQRIDEKGQLALGQWLTTDGTSRAQISVGQIGEVKIEPNSRVRLVEARGDEHRLSLSIGKMEAFIWAPPRQFFVDTPSAVAIDLGCSYTLEVNDDGAGLLMVTLGWVAFEWKDRESFVPAGAKCVTRPNSGPGTPYFDDSSARFQSALSKFDTGADGPARPARPARMDALNGVLANARKRDALTLWHLLARTTESERGHVYDRLADLIPPPSNVTREGVIKGDRTMIDAWWDKLELGDTSWWRMWKGPLPTQAK
ncbi:MAG: zf-HC2 domain-containing protein [Acidobacteria bacterium]|nr:zf-HC2 domain-containing protein [Acidobacteriota bacterium]